MNKKVVFDLLLIMIIIAVISFVLTPVDADSMDNKEKGIHTISEYTLPSSLIVLGDEAFTNTAIKSLALDESIIYIGRRAFWESSELVNVYVPRSVCYIGNDAFPKETIIHGIGGSFVQKWAGRNGYKFCNEVVWSSSNSSSFNTIVFLLSQTVFIKPDRELIDTLIQKRATAFIKSMRPQERPELNPIDYRFP